MLEFTFIGTLWLGLVLVLVVSSIFYIGYRMGRWSVKNILEIECRRYTKAIMNLESGDDGQKQFAKNLLTHFKNTVIICRMDED